MKNIIVSDDLKKEVKINGEAILLTRKEYDILYYLYQNPNQVLSKSQLFEKIWQDDYPEDIANAVSCQIYQLRNKIEPDPKNPYFILTIRGFGYKFSQQH